MDILRITARWTGFTGAPGYSNFFFAGGGGLISDAQQVANRVISAFSDLSSILPEDVRITLEPEAAVIDSDTGVATSFEQIDTAADAEGIAPGSYSAASGAVVNWRTNDVRFGRRIRGRTFIVPLSSIAYADDGTLGNSALGALRNFADTMIGGDLDSEFGVWSRPRDGGGGVFATATSYSVPDMAAVLRSRRD